MADEQAARKVRFGVFDLDFRTGELRKSGVRLKLDEQPFRILRALVLTPGCGNLPPASTKDWP